MREILITHCVLLLASALHAETLPRIEDFRLDLTTAEVSNGESRQARSVACQAYLYQFPAFLHLRQLSEILQARSHLSPGETALGGWMLIRDLSTPKTENTMPNVDTLYGAAFVWLEKQGPVVLTVPPIKDRYFSVALHDAWFNVFEVLGSRTIGDAGGSYLIVPPGWKGQKPDGIARVIESPTAMINLYQRIYLGAHDKIQELRALQDQIRLSPLSAWPDTRAKFPAIDDRAFRLPKLRETRDPLRFFELASDYTATVPPPSADESLVALFKSVGVGPGSRLPVAPHLREGLAAGAADAQNVVNAAFAASPFRNGWRVPNPNNAKAGPHILDRAVTQLIQIGVLPAEEALYYVSFRDGEGKLLDGRRPNRLVFAKDELPPVRPGGFWSVTMYDEKSFLVENPIQRYAIRPDTDGLTYGSDGSLTLYLQPESPANATEGNWLPTPKGSFIVALRCYLPTQPATSGDWFPPPIQPVK